MRITIIFYLGEKKNFVGIQERVYMGKSMK